MQTKRRLILVLMAAAMLVMSAVSVSTFQFQAQAQATAAATIAPTPTIQPTLIAGGQNCAASATKLTWYVGLGAGGNVSEITKETDWVNTFNTAHTDTCLILQVVNNADATGALKAMMAAGTPPDIVGPVGRLGRAAFKGQWADILPLAKAAGFDTSKYDPALLDFIKDYGVTVGLPFALYPAIIYYNKDLFDEAKLPYPPHKVGDLYMGKPWTIDAMLELAKKLTVDKGGNDATASSFDPTNITQYGFWFGYAGGRRLTPMWGGASLYDASNNAKIPDSYKAAWTAYYNSMWTTHVVPNADATASDLMAKGNPFSSGNVAMTWMYTWYTCCFDMKKLHWDIAVVPSYNGTITAGMDGDTFALPSGGKNQAAAFKVLSAMVVDKDLSTLYGGIPGNAADRDSFFSAMNTQAGQTIDWNVALQMLKYPEIPGSEAWMPNLIKANNRMNVFTDLLGHTPGLDINKEMDKLQTDLDAIFKAPETP